MSGASTIDRDIGRRTRLPRITLDEQQALVDYKRALNHRRELTRALKAAKTLRERDRIYEELDAAEVSARRTLNVLNAALVGDE